jgi:hypothetical protein
MFAVQGDFNHEIKSSIRLPTASILRQTPPKHVLALATVINQLPWTLYDSFNIS